MSSTVLPPPPPPVTLSMAFALTNTNGASLLAVCLSLSEDVDLIVKRLASEREPVPSNGRPGNVRHSSVYILRIS